MTATDELRRLLDDRGVEWSNIRNDGSESDYLTEWFENNQGKAIAIEWAVGSGLAVEIYCCHLTPEQAIAAWNTLAETKAERDLRDEVNWMHSELHGAEMEAKKLRELVRDMWTWQDALPYGMHAEVRDRMRELGVVE